MSNSNLAMRQRRTVPLEEDDDIDDPSITEDNKSRNNNSNSNSNHNQLESRSGHSRSGHSKSGRSSRRRRGEESSSSRRRRPNDDPSISRRLDPVRDSFKTNGSGHSRGSVSSMPSIDTGELKKKYQRKKSANSVQNSIKTPSTRSALTIGNSSVLSSTRSMLNSVASMPPLEPSSSSSTTTTTAKSPGLPDLFSLQRALNDCDEDQVDQLMQNTPSRQQSAISTPVAWKTPFEVDRPRLTPELSSRKTASSGASVATETDPELSKEQDAWAGIDNLLADSESLDDSFVFSMCDILPKDTVNAMRRGPSSGESVVDEDGESVFDESVAPKRSLAAISKNSNSSSHSSRSRGGGGRKQKHGSTDGGGSNTASSSGEDAFGEDDDVDDDDQLGELQASAMRGPAAIAKRDVTGGSLFDVFHWSDKANVDDARQRTKKLNQTKRKVQLEPTHVSNHSTESDDMSLPSLASFRHDELNMSRRSTASSAWDSRHHDVSSVVSEDISAEEFGGEREAPTDHHGDDQSSSEGSDKKSPSLAGDGLVLNKQVDDYIRRIQLKLPTISEDGGSPIKKKSNNSLDSLNEETSPSPTSILEDSCAFDQLPSLASLAGERVQTSPKAPSSSPRKIVDKKEPKQSLSFQFMSSIKKMGKVLPTTKKAAVANREEEKYFPEPTSPAKSKQFSANRSLLSETEDGFNWD